MRRGGRLRRGGRWRWRYAGHLPRFWIRLRGRRRFGIRSRGGRRRGRAGSRRCRRGRLPSRHLLRGGRSGQGNRGREPKCAEAQEGKRRQPHLGVSAAGGAGSASHQTLSCLAGPLGRRGRRNDPSAELIGERHQCSPSRGFRKPQKPRSERTLRVCSAVCATWFGGTSRPQRPRPRTRPQRPQGRRPGSRSGSLPSVRRR